MGEEGGSSRGGEEETRELKRGNEGEGRAGSTDMKGGGMKNKEKESGKKKCLCSFPTSDSAEILFLEMTAMQVSNPITFILSLFLPPSLSFPSSIPLSPFPSIPTKQDLPSTHYQCSVTWYPSGGEEEAEMSVECEEGEGKRGEGGVGVVSHLLQLVILVQFNLISGGNLQVHCGRTRTGVCGFVN